MIRSPFFCSRTVRFKMKTNTPRLLLMLSSLQIPLLSQTRGASAEDATPILPTRISGELVSGVPDAITGIIIGTVFSTLTALVGIWLTNRANAKRLAKQFSHERRSRIDDREYDIRKSTYLETVHAIEQGINILATISDPNTSLEHVTKQIVQKISVASKSHIVAEDDTIEAIAAVTTELALAQTRLISLKMEMGLLKSRVDLISQFSDDNRLKQNQMLEVMRAINLNPEPDVRRFQAAKEDFEFRTSELERLELERQEVSTKQIEKQVALSRSLTIEISDLYRALRTVVIRIREELNLPLDSEKYLALGEQSASQATEAAEQIFAELSA